MAFLCSLLAVAYLALPPTAAVWAGDRARRSRSFRPIAAFLICAASGLVVGVVACLVYARLVDATVPISQLLLASYLAVGVLIVLRLFSWLLKLGLERAMAVDAGRSFGRPRGGAWVARAALAIFLRSILLVAVGVPYLIGLAAVYRPRTVGGGPDPQEILPGASVERVTFESADGVRLVGWWIPARPPADPEKAPPDWGTRTVVLCHGLWSTKSTYLTLARDLWPSGYNVLAFDFRAHGESGGQTCSFGDRERLDVLAAVNWARTAHPGETKQVFGVGVDTGGAALLAAASEDSADARAIEAVAVLGTFDRLAPLLDRPIDLYFTSPVAWLARHVALPVASAHAGADLAAFAPADVVDRVAPRPVLVVHARADTRVPFEAGYRLFDHASVPRVRYWVGELDAGGRWVIRNNVKTRVDTQGVPRVAPAEGLSADQANVVSDEDTVRAIRALFELGKQVV